MVQRRYAEVVAKPALFLALTSLMVEEFTEMLELFETAFQEHMAEWTLEGKRRQKRAYVSYANSPLPTPQERLLFILNHLKENPTQTYHGHLYGLTEQKVNHVNNPQGTSSTWMSVATEAAGRGRGTSKGAVTALGVGAAAEQRHGAIGKECGNRTKGTFRVGEYSPAVAEGIAVAEGRQVRVARAKQRGEGLLAPLWRLRGRHDAHVDERHTQTQHFVAQIGGRPARIAERVDGRTIGRTRRRVIIEWERELEGLVHSDGVRHRAGAPELNDSSDHA